ncbi:serine aminopeptidase domain-containing protein [Parafrankia sp. EUN1f]|uniref:alpha/beta hydrolase family protein n=1 Tax=Parafrankia sp. EUN1f TaxID=102897 RepID=UPI0001C439E5|nr:alpha/beta hydrolase [Parafrankia sp. EUN1f]EFC85454.1 Platelet-activating factor acetylhydrolase plasma/intracellular isoform II [Parafrankia sp. EUN1f]
MLGGTLLATFGPPPAGDSAPEGHPPPAAAAAVPSRPDQVPPDEAPPPDQPGPYAVGYQTLIVPNPDRPDRTLTTSVWYPTWKGPTRAGERPQDGAARYPVASDIAVPSRVAQQGRSIAPGRFPLVVISHGSAGSRVQLAYLAEALATHGFVVAAPDHPGDTMIEAAEGRQAPLVELASDRLVDVSNVISAFTDDDCPLSSIVRADEIGVVGFSFGGLTSVVSTVGFLRAPADPRVRAVVGIAPATEVVPARLLGRVRVPALLIGGRLDGAVPFERNARRAFDELTGARPRYLVTVAGGTHNSFTEICAQAAAARGHDVEDGVRVRLEVTEELTCRPPAIDIDRAQGLATYYTVAFLESRLAGVPGYDSYLTVAAAAERHPEGELRVAS